MFKLRYLLIHLLLANVTQSFSQHRPISTPAVEFKDIIAADSLTKASLFKNAEAWATSISKSDEKVWITVKDSILGNLSGEGKFLVYLQPGLLKKISGAITYDFSLNVKDNKYRYRFNNFIFHYYKQDRYYNMVETGRTKALEEDRAVGWQRSWEQIKSMVSMKMMSQASHLKTRMVERPLTPVKRNEVEW